MMEGAGCMLKCRGWIVKGGGLRPLEGDGGDGRMSESEGKDRLVK